ncbi:unnamed protein product [Heterobilharzia americana]|nr:unnamed protein product [Heterobilharzia americana]
MTDINVELLKIDGTKLHSPGNEPDINIDNLLEHEVGAYGLWQWCITLCLMLSNSALVSFAIYANSAPRHRCRMNDQIENYIDQNNISFEVAATLIGPWFTKDIHDANQINGCVRYELNWTTYKFVDLLNSRKDLNTSHLSTIQCSNGYVFEDSKLHYPGNVIQEFSIVCQYAWFAPLGTSVFMFGMMLGFILSGICGDKFGRKYTMLTFAGIEFLGGIWTSLSPNFVSFMLARALMAVGCTGKLSVASVFVAEWTLPRYRSIYCTMISLSVNFLFPALMALWAYLIPNWRWLNIAITCPNLLSVFYYKLLPESPRWLLARRKNDTEYMLWPKNQPHPEKLESLAKFYCDKLPRAVSETQSSNEILINNKTDDKSDISNKKVVKTVIFASLFVFGIVSCVYGLLLYARVVKNYIYLVGFLNSTTAIPAFIISTVSYRITVYRKRPLGVVTGLNIVLLGGTALFQLIVKPETDMVLTICSSISLTLLNSSLSMCYIFVAELFPPRIRTRCFGIVLGVSRVGSMMSSFINELDLHLGHGAPFIVYCIILTLEFFILWILPETGWSKESCLSVDQNVENDCVSQL